MSSINSPTFDKETVDVFSKLHERLNESTDAVLGLSTLLNDSAAECSSDELAPLISVVGNQLHRIRCDFEELLYKTNVSGPALQVQGLEAMELLSEWCRIDRDMVGTDYHSFMSSLTDKVRIYENNYLSSTLNTEAAE